MSRPIITLTTDFGMKDSYVGAMKGVILDIAPDTTIVDVSHEVDRHNIHEAAYVLATASKFFPPHSIHVAVVDPGVGSSRRPLVLCTPRGTYISPDNGTLTHVLNRFGQVSHTTKAGGIPGYAKTPEGCVAYELDNPSFWLPQVTRTFHGRDVFAPSAAHLANGAEVSEMGTAVESIASLADSAYSSDNGTVTGTVVHIDIYGNLITNIPSHAVGKEPEIHVLGRMIPGLSDSYQESLDGLLAIIGSQDTLEIAVGEGDARTFLNASVGDRVVVQQSRA